MTTGGSKTALCLVVSCLALQACAEAGIAGQGISVVGSKKTIGDHLVSILSGKDCSSIRAERGFYYCKEDEPVPEQAVYCYRTLGDVTCYERKDPRRGGQRAVGNNDHNLQYLKR